MHIFPQIVICMVYQVPVSCTYKETSTFVRSSCHIPSDKCILHQVNNHRKWIRSVVSYPLFIIRVCKRMRYERSKKKLFTFAGIPHKSGWYVQCGLSMMFWLIHIFFLVALKGYGPIKKKVWIKQDVIDGP